MGDGEIIMREVLGEGEEEEKSIGEENKTV